MTVLFALMAACGAAGLAYSLLGQGRNRREASFAEALKEADGPSQDLARRMELLEEKVRLLQNGAANVQPAIAPEEEPESEAEPERPQRPASRRRQPETAGSLSGRMKAVWEASDRNKGPLEIARDLKMGISEVDLALKVRKMKPVRG